MHGQRVATLSQQRTGLRFAYTDAALAAFDLNTPLISVSLPLLPGVFKHDQAHPYFDGLLPEGEARRMLAYDFRVQENDTYGLLRVLGRDCAGALVIVPEGEVPPTPSIAPPVVLSNDDVARRLGQLDTEPLGVDRRVRISLAGVQQKLVLTRLASGDWALPIDGLPSTHILKRAGERFEHMVVNEAFCLAIGRRLGMRVVDAALMAAPRPALVVTRYDRERGADGTIRRVHQEDCAQALGIEASAKYEEHGGPGLRRLARLLRDVTRGSESLDALLDMTLLNMVVGNADAHAKNFALLHPTPDTLRLAPAYDVVSTSYYPQVDRRPAMAVNRKHSIDAVTAADVIAEAVSWGMPLARAKERVTQRLKDLPTALDAAARDVMQTPESLLAHVRQRASTFIGSSP